MLTDVAIRNAKPRDKVYKLADSGALYLWVLKTGNKVWRYKYRLAKKERTLTLGSYPDVKAAEARDKRDAARALVKRGIAPASDRQQLERADQEQQQAAKVATESAFETVAREWYAAESPAWTERHAGYVLRRLEGDLFPDLGARRIGDITAPDILAVLRKIEARDALEMARRARQYCSAIFGYAIAIGRAERDPANDLRKALKKAPRERHLAALPIKLLPEFLGKIDAYDGTLQTRLALKLLMLTAVRTSELRLATWQEFDIKRAMWTIPGDRMKMAELHLVPLSKQALAVLDELRELNEHEPTDLLFPSERNAAQAMSQNTLLFAIYRMGYHTRMTGHGVRTIFSTVMNEEGHFRPDLIEHQLAHREQDAVRAAYNRSEYIAERVKLMQWWADYLDRVQVHADLVRRAYELLDTKDGQRRARKIIGDYDAEQMDPGMLDALTDEQLQSIIE